jgi:hypothetical protein
MNLEKPTRVVTCTMISALALTVALAFAQDTQLQQAPAASESNERTIRGVWRTAVTPRNCQTGDAILTLSGLFTFNQGGTMSEYGIPPGSSPALRSPGHGVWRREHGWQDYSFAFTYYRYNASGVFVGSQRVRATLELGAGGDEFASRSAIEILDVDGAVIGTGCATALGTRFQ